jgi:hypothetical protein
MYGARSTGSHFGACRGNCRYMDTSLYQAIFWQTRLNFAGGHHLGSDLILNEFQRYQSCRDPTSADLSPEGGRHRTVPYTERDP